MSYLYIAALPWGQSSDTPLVHRKRMGGHDLLFILSNSTHGVHLKEPINCFRVLLIIGCSFWSSAILRKESCIPDLVLTINTII